MLITNSIRFQTVGQMHKIRAKYSNLLTRSVIAWLQLTIIEVYEAAKLKWKNKTELLFFEASIRVVAHISRLKVLESVL